jgi:TIR domain
MSFFTSSENKSIHVFLSFKTEEKDFAEQLKSALDQKGYVVWWQEEIQCGEEWHGEIDKAVSDAAAIVVLWSKKSILSPWVRHEASQAIVRGVYTPVRIEPMTIGSPYDRIQATDLFDWHGESSHPGLISARPDSRKSCDFSKLA